MAHFAELIEKTDPTGFTSDKHLVVERVVVVDNAHVKSDQDLSGEEWCVRFHGGGIWKQTSYHRKFRKQYAGIGKIYDGGRNKFLNQQPFASWSLDYRDDWQAPVTYPAGDQSGYEVTWNEEGQKWTGVKKSDRSDWNWDASALTWVSA